MRELRSILVTSLAFAWGYGSDVYHARPSLGGTLSSPAPQGSGASLAMFACALKHPLTRQDSINPPLIPPDLRWVLEGLNTYMYVFSKKATRFWPFFANFHDFSTIPPIRTLLGRMGAPIHPLS